MRVELRVESDEHEYVVTIEHDRSIPNGRALNIAQRAMDELINGPLPNAPTDRATGKPIF